MKKNTIITNHSMLPLWLHTGELQWGIVGNGASALQQLKSLLHFAPHIPVTIIGEDFSPSLRSVIGKHDNISFREKRFELSDLGNISMLIIATGNHILDEKIQAEAKQQNALVFVAGSPQLGDFVLQPEPPATEVNGHSSEKKPYPGLSNLNGQQWRKLASRIVLAFLLMIIGHIIISYMPFPPIKEIQEGLKPYFNYHFLFYILAGFLAQLVDGMLSMGYGVTSSTCLMSFGVNPVAMSAAIHTSKMFSTGLSGYSHYKFGNVNKKLFKHLVIPGVIGAVLGASFLVFVGEKGGRWLLPVMAVYAGFLGLKILFKAFQQQPKITKTRRIGWLAWVGGFLDAFGGGGWGPIVTSTLISKGRQPKYTVASVGLTEFFVTLASAFTFFVTVGVSLWNIVLGLLIGGVIAAPIGVRLAGKLPRKTMMIAVGFMVMVWCVRMLIKSFV